jgi:hypothetical protein
MVWLERSLERGRGHRSVGRIRVCSGRGARMGSDHRFPLGEKQASFFDQGALTGKTDPVSCRVSFDCGPIRPVAGDGALPAPCFPMAELPDSGSSGPAIGRSFGDVAQWRCRLSYSGRTLFAPLPELSRNAPLGNKPESFRVPSLAFSGRDLSGLSFSGRGC